MIHTQKHLSISDHANTFSLSALGRKNITGGSTLKLLASYLRLLKSLKSINKRRRSLKFQGLCPVLAKLIAEHHAHHGIRLADSRDAFAETLKCCLQANHWTIGILWQPLYNIPVSLHLPASSTFGPTLGGWRSVLLPSAKACGKQKTKWSNQHRKYTKISKAKNKMAPGHCSCMTQ